MSKSNIFYVRSLQLKFYGKKRNILFFLFEFENMLFNFCKNGSDEILIQIKLKWLHDELSNEESKVEFIKNIHKSRNQKILKPFKILIDIFSDLIQEKKIIPLYKQFEKFNKKFNNILLTYEDEKLCFNSSPYFQLSLYIYIRKNSDFLSLKEFSKNYFFLDKKKIDNFELVFIELFFKYYNLNNKKEIKKILFLKNLLIQSILK